ncbi:type II toxin-antitoxin system RelE/ParE family toxin [Peptococcaceae bacterium]|nr:type II toxin-antitoxin system RelE/ParE family toxin [Peptococcaceae bacterium]
MRKLVYLKKTLKFLQKSDLKTQKRIVDAIDKIPSGDIKMLQGNKNPPVYRLRIGKFRVIYHFEQNDNMLIIVKIDTRGDVYRQ